MLVSIIAPFPGYSRLYFRKTSPKREPHKVVTWNWAVSTLRVWVDAFWLQLALGGHDGYGKCRIDTLAGFGGGDLGLEATPGSDQTLALALYSEIMPDGAEGIQWGTRDQTSITHMQGQCLTPLFFSPAPLAGVSVLTLSLGAYPVRKSD